MAIRVVEFSNGGYKTRQISANFGLMASFQKVPKFNFQSQFSMSKIIEKYQFRSTFLLLTFSIKPFFIYFLFLKWCHITTCITIGPNPPLLRSHLRPCGNVDSYAKNLPNFVPPALNLHNLYYHNFRLSL
jgi:hypothetical protein